jgi:hypothetical protein
MGLLAGFIALAGLLGGLALLVLWAGLLERWVDGQDVSGDSLDVLMSAQETVAEESETNPEAPAESEPFAYPPAA